MTDQTSAHDPRNGYLPRGWTLAQAAEARQKDPARVEREARASMKVHVQAMLDLKAQGAVAFDYGNNIRQVALEEGLENAFDFPGFVPAYIRPLFCEGIGPFRWVALSGDPEDIYRTDAKVKELIPDDAHLHRWLDMARERIKFQGLPARICWVGLKDRARLGLAFNEMVAKGELSAPIVIGRDHLDSGSVASPNRETEAMKDGSDAVSDWAFLNALLNTASGATWVSIHHGGGVGMGFSQHAGVVIVCDGTRRRGRAHRARAAERPRHRRDAPRRRGLRARDRLRARAGPRPAFGALMATLTLKPGAISLADLRRIARGADAVALTDGWRGAGRGGARRRARAPRRRRIALRHQHRLRQAGEDPHLRRRARDAAALPHALARGGRRRAARGLDRAARPGAEGREPRARLLGRARGRHRAAARAASTRASIPSCPRRARSAPPATSRRSRTSRSR